MYKQTYIDYLKQFELAQQKFDANPGKKTATILSNLREDGKKFKNEDKYTPEYLTELRNTHKEYEGKRENRIKNCLETVRIETLFETGKITEEVRNSMHKINDTLNPFE